MKKVICILFRLQVQVLKSGENQVHMQTIVVAHKLATAQMRGYIGSLEAGNYHIQIKYHVIQNSFS